jgi:hypothetical protein
VRVVGAATFDPRKFRGRARFDRGPPWVGHTAWLAPASFVGLVAPPAGLAPDMVVGRLPVRDGGELDRIVAKIVAFGQGEGRERALLSYTDHDTEQDFEAIAGEMLSGLPATVEVRWLRRREVGAATREQLLRGLNDGPLVVSYAGHGSEDLWAGSVLTSADADLLTNRDRPVVLLGMTCLNGVFHSVWKTGLAEAMLLAERGGAVAAFASSGLTHAVDQVALNQHLLRGLLSPGLTLGEAILRAKAQTVDADVRNTWVLLGDPAMRLLAGAGQGGAVNGVRDAGASQDLDGGASPAPTMVDGGATPAHRWGCSYGPAGGGGWGTGALGLLALLAAAGAARRSRVEPPAAGS